MYKRKTKTWAKHYDFIIIDLIMVQIALMAAFWIRHGSVWIYGNELYRNTALFLALIDLLIVFFCESYKGILNRGFLKEFKATVKHITYTTGFLLLYLFLGQHGEEFSRSIFFYIWSYGIILSYSCRLFRKLYLTQKIQYNKSSLIIVTTCHRAEKAIKAVNSKDYEAFELTGICIVDKELTGEKIVDVPVVACGDAILDYIKENWVDEVLVNLMFTDYMKERDSIIRGCDLMGITVHQALFEKNIADSDNMIVESIGSYMVLTNSINMITSRQLFLKRSMDILSGIAGMILTGIIFLIIGPIIYIKSPGPIFFSQVRIGKNGKKFKIYKFRSMYMDAEERKKELMAQNEVKDGMMFKMENDPRIIKGIGHFIRETSLDEFPQFYNVLKGDMSLIGTRPPTVDEWEKYELHHRARMAIKPGITGMWQVSGRSDIKDFEEVVALDTKYIQNWTLGLDLKILLKTVKVVLMKEGSK